MEPWQQYQEDAARFFRSLGMSATTNCSLRGSRDVHTVDVLVTLDRSWLKQMWIVECKYQKRKVTKLHVLALSAIVDDLGADRGFLLSEVGFQAGTIRYSLDNNITLTGLADLYADAAQEISDLRINTARRRSLRLRDRLARVNDLEREGTPLPDGGDHAHAFWTRSEDNAQLLGRLLVVELAISDAELNRWPILEGIVDKHGLCDSNREAFARSLGQELDDIELQIESLEKS